jgi:outer membrane protein OmpA-like peptidoglycan-associated protein
MVEPDSDDLLETTCTNISNWRFALESSQRLLGYQLPLSLLLLNALHQTPGALLPSYCIWLACKTQEQAYKQLAQRLKTLTQHALDSAPASRAESMKTLVEIHISANFIQKYVLPRLMPDQAYRHSPLLVDINWMDAGRRVPQAEWRDAAHRISALRPTSSQQPWPVNPPLPENLTQYLPRLISCPPWLRNLAWLGIWLALAFAIASASSAWNNLQQIKLASSALQAYYLLKPDQEPALGKTVQYVQTLQTSFAKETEHGTPLRLGVGLYQGNTVNLKLNDAVRSYHPPKPTPQVVRLDNTALFDSSKAVLKAESKLALQSVLVWIQANPSKRVLIDGHTDNVGKAAANIRLSEERARAVRDWLVSASTFPITHFSVQGLGDTQPLASNNDEQGRSKNRRVEITLVQPPDSQENTPPTAGAQ